MMRTRRLILTLLIVGAAAAPASAGIIFNRKPKTNPNDRVVQLISTLKTEPDDHKRAAAAEELRDFDPTKYPEVVAVLLDCALRDKAANVRAEAVHSLGKLRPISPQVGYALEQIVANDSSVRVQVQARSALLSYRVSGYRSPKNGETPPMPPPVKIEEPPLADPSTRAAPPATAEKPNTVQAKKQPASIRSGSPGKSPEPPLAPTIPYAPVKAPVPPAKPPAGNDDGPILNPPK